MNSTAIAVSGAAGLFILAYLLEYASIKKYELYVDISTGDNVKVIDKNLIYVTIAYPGRTPISTPVLGFIGKYSKVW